MRFRFVAMLVVLSLLLSGCGYMVVEDAPVQVGSAHPQAENPTLE